MAQVLYCWRCKTDIPMLDEGEWEQVAALFQDTVNRAANETAPANKGTGHRERALERYFQITGFRETNANALWHHRISLFGPPCVACGKPLRTPKARLCAECGAAVP